MQNEEMGREPNREAGTPDPQSLTQGQGTPTVCPNSGDLVNCEDYQKTAAAITGEPASRLRLFTATAHVDRFMWRDDVTLRFSITERKRPAAPYEDLVADYHRMWLSDRHRREMEVDQLFLQEEAEIFQGFARETLGLEVQLEEVRLPVAHGAQLPDGFLARDNYWIPTAWWNFDREDRPELPFDVTTYLRLDETKESKSLDRFAEQRGVQFLRAALDRLQIGGIDDETLAGAVELVFKNHSLFVEGREELQCKQNDVRQRIQTADLGLRLFTPLFRTE